MTMFHLRSHFLHFLLLDIKFGQFYFCLTFDTGDLADINIYSLKYVCVKQKKKITQFCFSIYFNDCSFLMPQNWESREIIYEINPYFLSILKKKLMHLINFKNLSSTCVYTRCRLLMNNDEPFDWTEYFY